MMVVDANLLVYAHATSLPQHPQAHAWLDQQLNGVNRVGLPWPSLLGFMRLISNPRIFERAQTVGHAWRQVQEWLACENVWIPSPGERHAQVLDSLLQSQTFTSDLVPDAHWLL